MPKVGTAYVSIRARLDKLEKDLDAGKKLTTKRANETAKAVSNAFKGVIAYFGIRQLAGFGTALFDTGKQVGRLNKAFTEIAGSTAAANKEFDFLHKTADDLDQNFYELAESYRGILAASKDTVLAGQATKDIFIGITKAGATLGLTSDQISGALNAVQQIMSKGKVQAEELRGQLGERLPGAFNLAAEAMGVTTAELNKMLDDGKVLAEDLLPKLGVLLRQRYSGSVDEATAASNKFAEAWTDLKAAMASPEFLGSISSSMKDIAGTFKDPDFQAGLKAIAEGFGAIVEGAGEAIGVLGKFTGYASTAIRGSELARRGELPGGMSLNDFINLPLEQRRKIILEIESKYQSADIAAFAGAEQYVQDLYKKIDDELKKEFDLSSPVAKMTEKEVKALNKRIDEALEAEFNFYEKHLERYSELQEKIKDYEQEFAADDIQQRFALQGIDYTPDAAFDEMQEKAKETSDVMKDAFMGWGNTLSQTLTDAVWDAELSFGKIVESFGKMITQMMIQKKIVEPAFDFMFTKNAMGGIYGASSLGAYEGMVTNKPHFFTFANGGVFGEAGYEAIMPLRRTSSGKLGVEASGIQQKTDVHIHPVNESGRALDVQPRIIQKSPTKVVAEMVIKETFTSRNFRNSLGGLS